MGYHLVKPFVALLAALRDRLRGRLAEKGIHLPDNNPFLDPEGWNPRPDTMEDWRREHQDDN